LQCQKSKFLPKRTRPPSDFIFLTSSHFLRLTLVVHHGRVQKTFFYPYSSTVHNVLYNVPKNCITLFREEFAALFPVYSEVPSVISQESFLSLSSFHVLSQRNHRRDCLCVCLWPVYFFCFTGKGPTVLPTLLKNFWPISYKFGKIRQQVRKFGNILKILKNFML
jgi:hypothetical protein